MASRYVYNRANMRYRDTITGRFVSRNDIFSALERRMDVGFNQLDGLLVSALAPNVDFTFEQFQRAFLLEIRNQHVQAFVVGAGGRGNITPAMWGRLGDRIKREYRHARGFIQEIANGSLTENQIRARIGMYANSVWRDFNAGMQEQAEAQGFTEMRRVTRPGESCVDCIRYEALGWQPIGALPLPGNESRCRSNCRCVVRYR